MKRISLVTLILAAGFFIGAGFSYFYVASSMDWLPVINYPFRYLTLPFLVLGVIMGITTGVLEMSSRVK
ncbi:MAG: hypothetical protein ACFE7E_09015 [Candidatus Hodarchaeota archaeon]